MMTHCTCHYCKLIMLLVHMAQRVVIWDRANIPYHVDSTRTVTCVKCNPYFSPAGQTLKNSDEKILSFKTHMAAFSLHRGPLASWTSEDQTNSPHVLWQGSLWSSCPKPTLSWAGGEWDISCSCNLPLPRPAPRLPLIAGPPPPLPVRRSTTELFTHWDKHLCRKQKS